MNPVVVHGGGPADQRPDAPPGQGAGVRRRPAGPTPRPSTSSAWRWSGKVNREIVASVNRHGSYAVGLSGEDAGLINVAARDEKLGFVGDVRRIDPSILERLLREELIPVVATVGVDDAGQAYNVNADTVAGAIAASLRARARRISPTWPGSTATSPTRRRSSRASTSPAGGAWPTGKPGRGDDPEGPLVHRARSEEGSAPTSSTAGSPRAPARVLHPRGNRHDGDADHDAGDPLRRDRRPRRRAT